MADDDPEKAELDRRSRTPALGPWLILGLIALIALAVFVVSALAP